jgi:hypothetical protein
MEEKAGRSQVAGEATARDRLKRRTCRETDAGVSADLEKADLPKSETNDQIGQN